MIFILFIPFVFASTDNYVLELTDSARVEIPGLFSDAPESFTVEWWLYPYSFRNCNQRIAGNTDWGSFVFHTTETGAVYVGTDLATRLTPIEIGDSTLSANQWQYCAFTYDHEFGHGCFYKNGTKVASLSYMTPPQPWTGLFISQAIAWGFFDGKIDEVRVWSSALSEDHISAIFLRETIDPNQGHLVGYWKFNDRVQGTATNEAGEEYYGMIYKGKYIKEDIHTSLMGMAFCPEPQIGQIVDNDCRHVHWKSVGAEKWLVYLDTSYISVNSPVPLAHAFLGESNTCYMGLNNLVAGCRYYWRVDGVIEGDRVTGPVWNFVYDPKLLDRHMQFLSWKYGMFIHFSIGTFTGEEWADPDSPPELFNPTALDCGQWADLALNAGMKYVVLTVKHHDGFCLWPSRFTDYSVARSPWQDGHGDLVRDFVQAVRDRGLKVGLYYSIWDKRNGQNIEYVKNQLRELLTQYGKIDYLWFDGWKWQVGYESIPYDTIRDFVESIQPDCIVLENNGEPGIDNTDIVCFESIAPRVDFPYSYELCDRIIKDKWFWPGTPDGNKLVSAGHIIFWLNHTQAGKGSYLLNCSPDTSGLIPDNQAQVLCEVRDSLNIDKISAFAKHASLTVYPNPFYGSVGIYYAQDVSSYDADLIIYDILGREVKHFDRLSGELGNQVIWFGHDDSGKSVPSGVYFVRFKTDTHNITEKLLFLK